MDERDWLARRFEAEMPRLRAVAHRMLGSSGEADDAVQEAWLRVSRADAVGVGNLAGWLTTIVSRVCLDMLRSRRARREEPAGAHLPEPAAPPQAGTDPEHEALLADSVGLAMLVVLETLAPPERVAFVLHDMFAMPFEEIATILDRSPAASRQLASRARRRVQAQSPPEARGPGGHRRIVEAFLRASRTGELGPLLALLDPDAVLRSDAAAVRAGAPAEVRGAAGVAATFAGRARVARPALLDGTVGAVWLVGGRPRVAFTFTIRDEKILGVGLVADPERLRGLEVQVLSGES